MFASSVWHDGPKLQDKKKKKEKKHKQSSSTENQMNKWQLAQREEKTSRKLLIMMNNWSDFRKTKSKNLPCAWLPRYYLVHHLIYSNQSFGDKYRTVELFSVIKVLLMAKVHVNGPAFFIHIKGKKSVKIFADKIIYIIKSGYHKQAITAYFPSCAPLYIFGTINKWILGWMAHESVAIPPSGGHNIRTQWKIPDSYYWGVVATYWYRWGTIYRQD